MIVKRLLAGGCLIVVLAMSPAFANPLFRVGVAEVPGGVLDVSDGELTGSLADLYLCAFASSGLDIEFKLVPLKRGFYDLERGEIGALIPLAQTADRDRIADFAGELFRAKYMFITARPLPPISDIGDLRFGILRGFVGRIFIPDSAAAIEEVSKWAQLLPMLEFDRIDAAVMPSLLAASILEDWDREMFVQDAGSLPISMYLSRHRHYSDVASTLKGAVEDCRSRP